MENQRQRWVNGSFLTAAALLGYVVFQLATMVAGTYDLEARMQNIDLILRGVGVGVTALCFFILYANDKANQFMNEVVEELSRVTWPTSNDTSRATVVVIIMVIISGVILGGLDSLWTWIVKSSFQLKNWIG
ncbi:MAG: preprotein translocase subunit SecE [Bacteriovoracia bacterium]